MAIMKRDRRMFGALAGLACLALGCAVAAQAGEKWPSRTVEFVVTGSAGGDTDAVARFVSKYLTAQTGIAAPVTNMGASGGVQATATIKNSRPDGSRLLVGSHSHLLVSQLVGIVDYTFRDFAVSCIAGVHQTNVLVASKASGIKSLKDLIERAKGAPGTVTFGTETGSFSHLQALRLSNMAGIKLKLADVGATSERLAALLAGRIDLGVMSYGLIQDYVASGDMVVLAQGGAQRFPRMAEFPTFMEEGIDMTLEYPYIIAFPKGTPDHIVGSMSDIMKTIAASPEFQKDMDNLLLMPKFYDTKDAIRYLEDAYADFSQYRDLLRE